MKQQLRFLTVEQLCGWTLPQLGICSPYIMSRLPAGVRGGAFAHKYCACTSENVMGVG